MNALAFLVKVLGFTATTAPRPGTVEDPDVANMVVRQRAMGKRMRRQGRSLLSGKAYVPALTKFAEPASPQQPHNVVPLRKGITR